MLVICGCKHPLHMVTHSYVYSELPPPKDDSPLQPVQVIPGSDPCRKVALIDVDGLLLNRNLTGLLSAGENPVDVFREKLDLAAADPQICAVVLRINSPGGSATATDIMWRDLCVFRAKAGRPVVACLMDSGTGGAYYLACAADRIVAHPTTITGGIGVIFNLYDLQDTLATYNILSQSIKSGERIDMGSPVRQMTDESREILEQTAASLHQRFRNVVRQGRSLKIPDNAPIFDGRILTAQTALEHGLIDSIGYLDDAVANAAAMGGCPDAQTVILRRRKDVARTPYAVTPNTPLQQDLLPLSLPGLDRSKLPAFLYLWQPDPTIVR